MKNALIQFLVCALVGLGIGYLAFDVVGADKGKEQAAATEEKAPKSTEAVNEDSTKSEEKAETKTEAVAADNILNKKGCLGCHSVEKLSLQGGTTGPDLSQAYKNVEGKHGKAIDEFLKEPTSAVMSSVIGGSPLSDDEIKEVVSLLKEASEK